MGRFAEAHALAEEYLAIYNDLGSGWELAHANAVAGFPPLYLGQYEEAQAQAQKSLNLSLEVGHKRAIGWSSIILGWAALAQESYAEARQRLQECVSLHQELGDQFNEGQAMATLGYAVRGLGQHAQAQHHLTESLRMAIEMRDTFKFLLLVCTLPGIALLLADQGEKERAVELYALARTHPMVANSQWFEDIAGRHITAVAATLPPEVVAAAKARGQARDLWETAAELLAELEERGWGE
jgi:tetratricopeptide (TPR) repeat protein